VKRRNILALPAALAAAAAANKAIARPDPAMFPGLRLRAEHGSSPSRAYKTTPAGYRTLKVNASSSIGQIKSLQGVNGTPLGIMPGFADLYKQYPALGIDFVRMHDIFGPGEIDSAYINSDSYNAT
jgi:hypothetical protein